MSRLWCWKTSFLMRPRRYRNIIREIDIRKCCKLLEIGTYNGLRACQMIKTAALHHPLKEIDYYGFDLFEDLTNQDLNREFSKTPPSEETVSDKLRTQGANVTLYKGYTQDTLRLFLEKHKETEDLIDFVFVDGGHSVPTIENDWSYVKQMMSKDTIVIFDDYYCNTEAEIEGLGCQSILDKLDPSAYQVDILEPEDHFQKEWGILKVRMASVQLK